LFIFIFDIDFILLIFILEQCFLKLHKLSLGTFQSRKCNCYK